MKKLILSFSLFTVAILTANAKFILVNNNAGAIEKFQTAQVAYDSCSVGDTIYLAPSPNSYGEITIKKRITLLGVGLKDKTGKILTNFSTLNKITVDTSGNVVKTSGTIICGLVVNSVGAYYVFTFTITNAVRNIIVFNCYISNSAYDLGMYIGDNNNMVFDNIFANKVTLGKNVNFHNNVLSVGITGGTNCNVANNIFLGAKPISEFTASTFTNNIFISTSGAESPLVNSYANNVQGLSDLPTGNLNNMDITTVFTESAVGTVIGTALIGLSFTIKTDSPAITYGVDGTEVGVYGNINPWPKGVVYTRSPGVLPVVTSIIVQNQTVAPGATLKFNLKAKSLK